LAGQGRIHVTSDVSEWFVGGTQEYLHPVLFVLYCTGPSKDIITFDGTNCHASREVIPPYRERERENIFPLKERDRIYSL